MDNLVYEDKPPLSYGDYNRSLTKDFIIWLPMAPLYLAFIAFTIYIIIADFRITTQYFVFVYAFGFIFLLFWLLTLATKYQIFKDKLRITRGWIFRFDIPFTNIESVREAAIKDMLGFHLNFVPLRPGDDVVQITRKHGCKVNIIPTDRRVFLRNLNQALDDWKGHYVSF